MGKGSYLHEAREEDGVDGCVGCDAELLCRGERAGEGYGGAAGPRIHLVDDFW